MLEKQLKQYFGYSSFRSGQKEVIARITKGESAVAIFPTGAGKSLCYQLPAMLLPHLTLVVSPLLALMKDQVDFLSAHHIPAARLDSTLEPQTYNEILTQAKTDRLKILMISVERFKNERFRQHLEKMKISLLVVDEAHCISQWGHNFRPEYLKLPAYRKAYHIAQTLLLTATAAPPVIEDMCAGFEIPKQNVVVTGFYRQNLFLTVTPTKETNKRQQLLDRIREEPEAPTIVYVTLQRTAEEIAAFLGTGGINAAGYHAGMQNEDRERIQNQFMDGARSCVVATIAFGMGIDKADIRRVIHFDLPKSIESYSQEIGRAGRDGKPALCEVLANRNNISILENFVYGDTPEKKAIADLLERIKAQPDFVWELKLLALAFDLNIRPLPLRTLLVYLEMDGIIRPKHTYFDQYAFQFLTPRKEIIDRFQGERRQFAAAIFEQSETKKVWTYVDIDKIVAHYTTDRKRVVAALDYFDEQGWIRLQSRQAIDVFDLVDKRFDIDQLARSMYEKFKNKESREIARIQQMVGFFESKACLSKALALYFGEAMAVDHCGHCSVCEGHPAKIEHTLELEPLAHKNLDDLSSDYLAKSDQFCSPLDVAKFLCGIQTPFFARAKVKKMPNFGVLQHYPFMDVRTWIEAQRKNRE